MIAIEKSIVVEAPPERVFAFLDDPVNLPEVWPSMVEVEHVVELPSGGHRFHWVYKMAGKRFEGDAETVEIEQPRHHVLQNTGEIPSRFDWTFAPEDGSTRIVMKTEYELPETLLGKLARPFLVKLNEREADTVLANVKDRLES